MDVDNEAISLAALNSFGQLKWVVQAEAMSVCVFTKYPGTSFHIEAITTLSLRMYGRHRFLRLAFHLVRSRAQRTAKKTEIWSPLFCRAVSKSMI
jgi:hypothetical protein